MTVKHPPSELLPPVQFTRREARLLADMLVNRRATMTTVDRDDITEGLAMESALKKIAAVRIGEST